MTRDHGRGHRRGTTTEIPLGLDPSHVEPAALDALVPLRDQRVLEIGTGDGRLAFCLNGPPQRLLGTDRNVGAVVLANGGRPPGLEASHVFLAADATALPFHTASFEVAVLGWSL